MRDGIIVQGVVIAYLQRFDFQIHCFKGNVKCWKQNREIIISNTQMQLY